MNSLYPYLTPSVNLLTSATQTIGPFIGSSSFSCGRSKCVTWMQRCLPDYTVTVSYCIVVEPIEWLGGVVFRASDTWPTDCEFVIWSHGTEHIQKNKDPKHPPFRHRLHSDVIYNRYLYMYLQISFLAFLRAYFSSEAGLIWTKLV